MQLTKIMLEHSPRQVRVVHHVRLGSWLFAKAQYFRRDFEVCSLSHRNPTRFLPFFTVGEYKGSLGEFGSNISQTKKMEGFVLGLGDFPNHDTDFKPIPRCVIWVHSVNLYFIFCENPKDSITCMQASDQWSYIPTAMIF